MMSGRLTEEEDSAAINQNGALISAITHAGLLRLNEACSDESGYTVEHGRICMCEHSGPFHRGTHD